MIIIFIFFNLFFYINNYPIPRNVLDQPLINTFHFVQVMFGVGDPAASHFRVTEEFNGTVSDSLGT